MRAVGRRRAGPATGALCRLLGVHGVAEDVGYSLEKRSDRDDLEAIGDRLREVRQILDVVLRYDHRANIDTSRRKKFFRETADCKNAASKGDFARHCDVRAYPALS